MGYKKHFDSRDAAIVLALADNAMNPTRVAEQTYMHRNSVIYRLRKIRDVTGLDPMSFRDLGKLVEMAKRQED